VYPVKKERGLISMDNQLVPFAGAEFNNVRVIRKDGQPWFVGKDVCNFFGDKNHNRSLSRIDDEDKTTVSLETKGGRQNLTAVNESGLYALLLNMRPQKANKSGAQSAYSPEVMDRIEKLKTFRRWVTHDVLPAVRQQGEYETEAVIQRREALWLEIEADMKKRGVYDRMPEGYEPYEPEE